MIDFKEAVKADRSRIFVDLEHFGERHFVDKSEITCVIDSDTHAQRYPELGVEAADMRLFALSEDLGERREAGEVLDVDGMLCTVVSWQDEMGICAVSLTQNRHPY